MASCGIHTFLVDGKGTDSTSNGDYVHKGLTEDASGFALVLSVLFVRITGSSRRRRTIGIMKSRVSMGAADVALPIAFSLIPGNV